MNKIHVRVFLKKKKHFLGVMRFIMGIRIKFVCEEILKENRGIDL